MPIKEISSSVEIEPGIYASDIFKQQLSEEVLSHGEDKKSREEEPEVVIQPNSDDMPVIVNRPTIIEQTQQPKISQFASVQQSCTSKIPPVIEEEASLNGGPS